MYETSACEYKSWLKHAYAINLNNQRIIRIQCEVHIIFMLAVTPLNKKLVICAWKHALV